MKLIFMGTPDFAVPALEALLAAGHEVAAVFTQPDKPVGRRQLLTAPPVKALALSRGIPVYQEASLKTGAALEIIKKTAPDCIVVAAYGKILPKDILAVPPLGCVNIHASLLPKYRGAAPIQWAVIRGERETGVTTMLMDEGLDTGDILETAKTPIGENETAGELFGRLSRMGGELIVSTLGKLSSGSLTPVPQTEAQATWAPPLDRSVCEIDWGKPAQEIHDLIRGLNPWPVAETVLDNKRVKIFVSRLTNERAEPGAVLCTKKGFAVACGDGALLRILELQPKAKKRMTAAAFLCGCQNGFDRVERAASDRQEDA